MTRVLPIALCLFGFVVDAGIVRSNVGSRFVSINRNEEVAYTASDYVQEGLIAMWDGIENVGYGLHDSSSPIWVDLIGDNDLTLHETTLWEDKCSYQPNNQTLTAYRENSSLDWNFAEIVCDWSLMAGTSTTAMFFSGGKSVSDDCPNVFGNWLEWYNSGRTKYFVKFIPTGRAVSHAEIESLVGDLDALKGTISIDKVNSMIWRNAEQLEMISNSIGYLYNTANIIFIGSNQMNGERGFRGKFYNVRIYNRVLSQDEIKHNYLIDKGRFGL